VEETSLGTPFGFTDLFPLNKRESFPDLEACPNASGDLYSL